MQRIVLTTVAVFFEALGNVVEVEVSVFYQE
jgi:hypothetical protein